MPASRLWPYSQRNKPRPSNRYLIGNVPIEQTVKSILGYLGLLLLCLLVVAFVRVISTALPRAFGY